MSGLDALTAEKRLKKRSRARNFSRPLELGPIQLDGVDNLFRKSLRSLNARNAGYSASHVQPYGDRLLRLALGRISRPTSRTPSLQAGALMVSQAPTPVGNFFCR